MTGRQSQLPHQPLNELYFYCHGCRKRAFTSRRGAKISLKELVKYHGDKSSALHVYHCPENADCYHVGHRDARFT